MTKIQEIHELLWNIQKGVSEKREEQEKKLEPKISTEIKNGNLTDHELKELKTELEISLEHTKGQLYEVNYILENFWEIISK